MIDISIIYNRDAVETHVREAFAARLHLDAEIKNLNRRAYNGKDN